MSASSAMCAGHCPAERWRTRLIYITHGGSNCYNNITALNNLDSVVDKYQTRVLRPLVTRRLATDDISDCLNSLIVCVSVLS